jgi:glycogen synthase
MWAINEALSVYGEPEMMEAAVKNTMSCDYSWDSSAAKYIKLYKKLAGTRTEKTA